MKKVNDILTKRGAVVISISSDAKIIEALQLMQDSNVGSVVVMDQGKYRGILTERDYARKVILLDKNSSDTLVSEIMSVDLPGVQLGSSIEVCMILMSENNIRYLPVIENGELVGIISSNDLIKATIQDHLETIEHLKNYIHA
jgi:hypothetical protein